MESTQPLPVTPPPPKKKFPILTVLLLLLFLAATSAAGYFFYQYQKLQQKPNTSESTPTPAPSPTTTDTSNWKTYTNSKYMYQFKYPNDFKLKEDSIDQVSITNNLPPDPTCKGGGCHLDIQRLSIYFVHTSDANEETMNLDDYANARKDILEQFFSNQGAITRVNKYGLDLRFMEGVGEGYLYHYYLKLNSNTNFMIEVVFPSKEEIPKYESMLDQILSTFKVIDQSQTIINTSNWKTYTNNVRKYSIKYPSDWIIDSSKAETDLAEVTGARLEIYQGEYRISIFWPSAYGPGVCIFDDQPREGVPEIANFCEGEYQEFQSLDNKTIYRHLKTPSLESGKPASWSVYSKSNGEYFATIPPISFFAPSNYSQTKIDTMDMIISSVTSTN